jgi:ADP-ribose pyrophosphatase YjhB (NUDIX family)
MMKIVGRIWRKLPASVRMKIVRVTQKKFTASVAAIVQNEKGEVLLLDHVLRPASGWGIPGGFLDFGEQPIDAVKRELRE